MRVLSISKFEDGIINEDAAKATPEWIAVSDGAGGGGVFADKWSEYLVKHIPMTPIADFAAFDNWIDSIWESFYNEYEKIAKHEGGMLLNKFYDEGSFATLVTIWRNGQWISYGDSVAFCYDMERGTLQHSFGHIVDFNNPPYLINCKDALNEEGFQYGQFKLTKNSLIFAASDALAHYILMMYEVTHKNEYAEELQEAINAQTKDSNFIKTALELKKIDFEDVIKKLPLCKNQGNYRRHVQLLRKKGLIAHDDYSLAIM